MGFEFDDLPDVLLLKIYSNLNLRDKYRLSQVNIRLYNLFSNPLLWEDCYIVFKLSYHIAPNFFMFDAEHLETAHQMDQFGVILTRYGHYVKNLSFILVGNIDTGTNERTLEDLHLLISHRALQYCCNIETFTIETGKWSSRSHVHGPHQKSTDEFLNNVCQLIIKNEKRLRKVNVNSWPISSDDEFPIILKRLPDLEEFSLFCKEVDETTWIQQNAYIPQPDHVINCLQRLKNLISLSLHCASISSQLLNELSSTKPRSNTSHYSQLRHLKILLTYENQTRNFYYIHFEFWRKLYNVHKNLKISICIGNKIPLEHLSLFLEAIQPFQLHSVSISKFSRYEATLLGFLSPNCKHLKSFIDYSKGCSDLSDLISFVDHCPSLDALIYNGDIEDSCLIQLITMRHWKTFQINLDNVIIQYPTQPYNPDHVIVKDEQTGQYVQASLFLQPEKGFHLTDDNESFRRNMLDKIETLAKNNLKCIWKPLRRGKDCMW